MKKLLIVLLWAPLLASVQVFAAGAELHLDKAPDRGWEGAEGLEWTLPSPAPYHTFETAPVVK